MGLGNLKNRLDHSEIDSRVIFLGSVNYCRTPSVVIDDSLLIFARNIGVFGRLDRHGAVGVFGAHGLGDKDCRRWLVAVG